MIRACPINEVLQASDLLAEYAEESAISGMPTPTAKLEAYAILEKGGALKTFGAYLEDKLVGFITVLSMVLPHYSVCTSVVESFFVTKNHRKTGAGTKLRYAAEAHTEAIGSAGLLISAPLEGILAKVLPGAGYVETNRVFFKKVGSG